MSTSDEPRTGLAVHMDELRNAVAKADALAHAAEEMFDSTVWSGEVDQQRLERVAHLIGAAAQAAEAALAAVDRLHTAIADARSAEPGGDRW